MPEISKEKFFKRLLVFQAVAKSGGISKAAKRLDVSQPAVSYLIRSLEEDLGVELFVRRGTVIALTQAGKDLLRRTAGLLKTFDGIKTAMRLQCMKGYRGDIVLATTQSFAENCLAAHVKRFRQSNPEVHFSVRSGMGSQDIVSATAKAEVDFGITSLFWIPRNIQADFLFHTRLVLIAPRDRHFSRDGQGALADLGELDGIDFLARPQSVTVQRYVDRYLLTQDIRPNFVASLANYSTIRTFVRDGVGCAIVEDFERTDPGWYDVYPLPYDSAASSYYILRGKKRYTSPQSAAFVTSLLQAEKKGREEDGAWPGAPAGEEPCQDVLPRP